MVRYENRVVNYSQKVCSVEAGAIHSAQGTSCSDVPVRPFILRLFCEYASACPRPLCCKVRIRCRRDQSVPATPILVARILYIRTYMKERYNHERQQISATQSSTYVLFDSRRLYSVIGSGASYMG